MLGFVLCFFFIAQSKLSKIGATVITVFYFLLCSLATNGLMVLFVVTMETGRNSLSNYEYTIKCLNRWSDYGLQNMFNFLSVFGDEQEGNVNINWELALISRDT